MPLLFPNLRVTQIFGANTDVGKTLLTTSLLRATAKLYQNEGGEPSGSTKKVYYLKPVSTGAAEDADDAFVKRNTSPYASTIRTRNLYQYNEPVSPHLAQRLAPDLPFPRGGNEEYLNGVRKYVNECATKDGGVGGSLWLETAGGVHSPSLHPPLTQIDSLRPLLLPTLLIASPHLGGISTTISAYESLILRGYTVVGVMCLRDEYYRNWEFLEGYFKEKMGGNELAGQGVGGFWSFDKPAERGNMSRAEDTAMLERYYQSLETERRGQSSDGGRLGSNNMVAAARRLERIHEERIAELESMPRRTMDQVWWPFTQHGLIRKESQVMVIDSAKGDNFDAFYKSDSQTDNEKTLSKNESQQKSLLNPLFDGSGSWFTQAHGHANVDLTLAAAQAAGRYGHVLFPSSTHAPALALTETLLSTVGKGWASRVFFSDNGSTGMEVGLKMAMRACGRRYGWEGTEGSEVGVIGLRGGYHGDTIGVMDASEQSIFNDAVDWYRGRGHWFAPPTVSVQDGAVTISSTGPEIWPPHPINDAHLVMTEPDSAWSVTLPSIAEVYDIATRLESPLAAYYRDHITSELKKRLAQGKRFGAVVIEPICLGAGGMVFVDPLFQRCLIDVVRESEGMFGSVKDGSSGLEGAWKGLPVLFDEVFSGLHRLSYLTANSILLADPDIQVNAKILTGGLLPLSTTTASESIFDAFWHKDKKVNALLHGHSYTATPIGCSVALKALDLVRQREESGEWNVMKAGWIVTASTMTTPEAKETSPFAIETAASGQPRSSMASAISPSSSLTSGASQYLNPGAALWSFWSRDFVYAASELPAVKSAMAMGTLLAIELQEPAESGFKGYASSIAQDLLDKLRLPENRITPLTSSSDSFSAGSNTFDPFHIHSRPLGNVVYLMTSLWTEPGVVRAMEAKALEVLQNS